MALVSPGIQISINDQSQYVNSNVGSVPLVLLATAQDKTYNSAPATGTSKINAGKLLSFSSQRDLVTQMGTPSFQLSSAGTPVNGSEINEYGLLASYSALGLGNQLYAIRADVDLNQLRGTSIRPIGLPLDGIDWLDTVNTEWGIYETDTATQAFAHISPTLIENSAQVGGTPATPIASVGNVGDYALVLVNSNGTTATQIRLFYKSGAQSAGSSSVAGGTLNNVWVQVGSTDWQKSVPTITGTVSSPFIPNTSTLIINTVIVTTSATTTVAALAKSINTASIPGVFAGAYTTSSGSFLQLFVTSAATSNGATVDGILSITDGTNSPIAACGIATTVSVPNTVAQAKQGKYSYPLFAYGSYAYTPAEGWFGIPNATGITGHPSGSVWWKTSVTGVGFNPVLQKYNATSGQFSALTVPFYTGISSAIYALDPIGGGINVTHGQVIVSSRLIDASANTLIFYKQADASIALATGATPSGSITGAITISGTVPGSPALAVYPTITLSGTTATSFVSDILAAGIPYVTAQLNSSGTITLTHTSGGQLSIANSSGTPLTSAGFGSAGPGYTVNGSGVVNISNWISITGTIQYSASAPYTAPATGTYWYYSNAADVDIMINQGGATGWQGYRNVGYDVRGYALSATDPRGVIIAASKPTSQAGGTALVAGDLWLDTADLVNYPALYRYNGGSFIAINKTDHTSSNGIIFADARWDTGGTTDVVSGTFPPIADLLTSNYLDLDAPDYRLYPAGTLLFNTRRSGYNVKKFVSNYYNSLSFPNVGANSIGLPTILPTITDAWVNASGLDSNDAMNAGNRAQRSIVVSAMQSAIDSNLDVLSTIYQFNLMCAPGYPEVIPNMITLNDNRGDTAFIIGDTPLDLTPNTVALTNWVNNVDGNGLPSDASSAAYLGLYYPAGRTNDLAGNTVVVPASHAVLRTFLYNDNVSHPWFAPAGTHRGLVSNMSDIGYLNRSTGLFVHNAIGQGLRDALYTLAINPITQLPSVGLCVWGQLTRSGSSTARNRVNVVRLENYLRTVFNSVANGYLFEPNDAVTRKSIARQIESSLHDILAKRGLYDFLVICDTNNNTPATISNNQLYVDVAIEPMRDVEFIYIPIAIYNPGSIAALNVQSS